MGLVGRWAAIAVATQRIALALRAGSAVSQSNQARQALGRNHTGPSVLHARAPVLRRMRIAPASRAGGAGLASAVGRGTWRARGVPGKSGRARKAGGCRGLPRQRLVELSGESDFRLGPGPTRRRQQAAVVSASRATSHNIVDHRGDRFQLLVCLCGACDVIPR